MSNELFTEVIEQATVAGKSLDEIDAEIIEPAVLSPRQKGALLLFAYSLRRPGEQRRYAQESLAITGIPLQRTGEKHPSQPLSGSYLRERSGRDRRSSDDRRERQDAVAVERRSGLDRRGGDRRRARSPSLVRD